ncbi:MAG: hypothetical protein GF398_02905 [Chitinivibrionales bacterium]|nr:hypothetical protein [Chitinivibrionales bacterium]
MLINRHLKQRIPVEAILRKRIHPLFEAAHAQAGITAWACANDQIGKWASRFIKEHTPAGVAPVDIYGFDDSDDALESALSTFNFRIDSVVYRILGFLTNMNTEAFTTKAIEIEGMIVDRNR